MDKGNKCKPASRLSTYFFLSLYKQDGLTMSYKVYPIKQPYFQWGFAGPFPFNTKLLKA